MSPDKDDELCKKYPNLYAQRNWKMDRTCMCWGFECGDGWYDLIDELSSNLERFGVQAMQVKEKFGGLRFYISGYNPKYSNEIDMAIGRAEKKSIRTCEKCGKPGSIRDWGWLQTLCNDCWGKKQADLMAKGHLLDDLAIID
jgi:hypothetical protein